MTDLLDPEIETGDEPDGKPFGCAEEGCEFRSASMRGLKRHETVTHGIRPEGGEEPPPGRSEPSEPPAAETAPRPLGAQRGRQGLFERVRTKLRSGKSSAGGAPSRTAPKKRVASRARIPLEQDLTGVYSYLGEHLERSTIHYPAGRMMQYQALGAGVIADKALAGTALDRYLLQPIWRSKDRWEDVFYLMAPPVILVGMQSIRARQQAAAEAGDMDEARRLDKALHFEGAVLEGILRSSLLRLAPAIAEARERAAKEDEAIREAFPDLPPDLDPVKVLLSSLFEPPGQQEAKPDVGDRYQPNGDGPGAPT